MYLFTQLNLISEWRQDWRKSKKKDRNICGRGTIYLFCRFSVKVGTVILIVVQIADEKLFDLL